MKKKKNRILCSIVCATGLMTLLCHILNKTDKKEFNSKADQSRVAETSGTLYEKYLKRVLDVVISGLGIIFLSPVIVLSMLIVFLEDPGPAIFKQKRVGNHKSYFYIHKLRSMKQNCPDIPTHLMDNPDQYLLKSGKMFRKYSIDELPQLIDILRGKMSLVGPRPALWNQDDLVAERDKYGANDVVPGLTGWAQINGRDELEIPDKAKLDGEYVKALKKSSISGFLMDCRCLLGTVTSVLHHDGVVEGGTGELHREEAKQSEEESNAADNPQDIDSVIGFEKPVTVSAHGKKKVLITGAGSYIGESFEAYAKKHYPLNYEIDTLDMRDAGWREKDFSGFDIVYHVAGIAHADVGNVSEETKKQYYAVNTDLAVETAERAKAAGVKLFVFMSSMIVYGESAPFGRDKIITAETKAKPANFYGDSKWQADMGIRALADGEFKVAVLRPPMIYGKGSKGNYPTLAKMAKKLPVFPDVENQRSMLYIENLCEFLCRMMLVDTSSFSEKGNVFFPQNSQYTKTSEMVRLIAENAGHKILVNRVLAPAVFVAGKIPGKIGGLVNKAFGNSCYDQQMSVYDGMDYRKVSLAESIRKTEGAEEKSSQKPKALVLASVASMIDQFNMNNIQILLGLGYEVEVAANFVNGGTITEERVADLKNRLAAMSVTVHHVPIPREISKLGDIIASYRQVKQLCNQKQYRIVHCHSPIGGVIARLAAKDCRKKGTKVIYTAHGFHFYKGAPVVNWLLYYPIEKICSYWTDVLITINKEDYAFAGKHMRARKVVYIPGVGVDVAGFELTDFDKGKKKKELGLDEDTVVLLSVGELNENKNHEIIVKAIAKFQNNKIHYLIAGQGPNERKLMELARKLGVNLHLLGYRTDITELYHVADIFALPSKREGLSVALMEAMACGLPCVVSKIRGNVDLIEDGVGGYLCEPDDVDGFALAMRNFINNEILREKFGKENIKKITGCDVENINQKMKNIYFEY